MAYTHEDKVKKMELGGEGVVHREAVVDARKKANLEITEMLRNLFETYPEMRFEQLLSCLLGHIDFYRESVKTLEDMKLIVKTYGWAK